MAKKGVLSRASRRAVKSSQVAAPEVPASVPVDSASPARGRCRAGRGARAVAAEPVAEAPPAPAEEAGAEPPGEAQAQAREDAAAAETSPAAASQAPGDAAAGEMPGDVRTEAPAESLAESMQEALESLEDAVLESLEDVALASLADPAETVRLDEARRRLEQVSADGSIRVAFQPIVDLTIDGGHRLRGAGALSRGREHHHEEMVRRSCRGRAPARDRDGRHPGGARPAREASRGRVHLRQRVTPHGRLATSFASPWTESTGRGWSSRSPRTRRRGLRRGQRSHRCRSAPEA